MALSFAQITLQKSIKQELSHSGPSMQVGISTFPHNNNGTFLWQASFQENENNETLKRNIYRLVISAMKKKKNRKCNIGEEKQEPLLTMPIPFVQQGIGVTELRD